MDFSQVAAVLLPLIAFVILDAKAGPKMGVYGAIAISVIMTAFLYFKYDDLDMTTVAELIILGILGLLTLKLDDSRYFKFQPTVVGVLFGGYVLYLQAFSEPILIRFVPLMTKMNPGTTEILTDPIMQQFMRMVSLHLGFLLLLHAALMAYAALKLSSKGWIWMRLAIYPMLIVLLLIDKALFSPT